MSENLLEHAATQYDKWEGTVAADDVDMHSVGGLIGIDTKAWDVVVIDVHVLGGYQTITAWATPRDDAAYEVRKQLLNESGGVLNVTKVAEWHEEPSEHADTNPPPSPAEPITWATDLVAFGFKRLHIRMIDIQPDFRPLLTGIYEVASIVEES